MILQLTVMVQVLALSARDTLGASRDDQQGQASLEYLAVLAVAAAVVALVLGLDLATKAGKFVTEIGKFFG